MASTKTKPARRRAPAADAGPAVELLDDYIAELSRIPVLSAEDQKNLARVLRDTDRPEDEREEARATLVRANLRFAFSIAKKFQHRGVGLEDLVSEANAGLLRAADKFDPEVGVNFISYAVWWIRQALLASLAEQGHLVRLPLGRGGDVGRIARAETKLVEELGRTPTDEEISRVSEVALDMVRALRPALAGPQSLDEPLRGAKGPDGSRTLADVLAAPDEEIDDVVGDLEQESRRGAVHRALDVLPPRERAILRMYYGLDGDESLTLTSIAERFGITRERVRQLRDRALERLREAEAAKVLREDWAA